MAIRVLRYGALKPKVGFDLVLEQLRLANRYYNALLEIELWRRAAKFVGVDSVELKEARNLAIRDARKNSGLGWGTYQAIERASKQSCKRMQDVSFLPNLDIRKSLSRLRPRFKRYNGTGTCAAALQRCSGNSDGSVQIVANGKYAICRLRVLGEHWIEVPIVLHRPIPVAATIVMGSLHVDRVGNRWVYSVTLTIDEQEARTGPSGSGNVAVNFGWRTVSGGVRIATAVGDNGVDELVLPAALISKRGHAESLRSLGDKIAAEFLGNAKRRWRMRRDSLKGKGPSPSGAIHFDPAGKDPNNPDHLEHWARRDRHLYQWEQDEVSKMMLARREIYRLWARKLRSQYGTVVVEDFDLRRVIGRDRQEIPNANYVRFLVAPSYLRAELKAVFCDDATIVKQRCLTQTCHVCNKKVHFDAARNLTHECEHCGASWDQDVNNAENQLLATAAE